VRTHNFATTAAVAKRKIRMIQLRKQGWRFKSSDGPTNARAALEDLEKRFKVDETRI